MCRTFARSPQQSASFLEALRKTQRSLALDGLEEPSLSAQSGSVQEDPEVSEFLSASPDLVHGEDIRISSEVNENSADDVEALSYDDEIEAFLRATPEQAFASIQLSENDVNPGEDLLQELIGDYTLPPRPVLKPDIADVACHLTPSQKLTLRFYRIWNRTNGTVEAYKCYSELINSISSITILSLSSAQSLLSNTVNVFAEDTDMCPNSCIAYTGRYRNLQSCPFVRDRNAGQCGRSRYSNPDAPPAQRKAARSFKTIPIHSRIQARFAGTDRFAQLMKSYAEAKFRRSQQGHELDSVRKHFTDHSDGWLYWKQRQSGLHAQPTDSILSLSTDGAQLKIGKQSDVWIIMLTFLDTPPELRSTKQEVMICGLIPGPLSPGDLESFMWPTLAEIARATVGLWTWNALTNSFFLWKATLSAVSADMLGATKMNRMTGHQGYAGCKTCLLPGCAPAAGGRTYYFPLATTGLAEGLNLGRSPDYDPLNLPMRSEESFRKACLMLSWARNNAERKAIQRVLGHIDVPLVCFSPGFSHPFSSPPDMCHLPYANVTPFLYDTFTIKSDPLDPMVLSVQERQLFGRLLVDNAKGLPTAFAASAPRNVDTKRNTQYKIHEWASILHHYMIPFLRFLKKDLRVIDMMTHLAVGVKMAMSVSGLTRSQLDLMRQHFVQFCYAWERLYIRGQSTLVSRARSVRDLD